MISEWVNWRGLVPVLNELVLLLLRVPARGRGVMFNFACYVPQAVKNKLSISRLVSKGATMGATWDKIISRRMELV